MDVDKIQKINKLALELMNQNLATDREDAVAQAERILKGRGIADEYSDIRERMGEGLKPKEEKNAEVKTEVNMLSQEKIEGILSQNTAFLVKKITEFTDKMEAMDKEMGMLKNQIRSLSGPVVREMSNAANVSTANDPRGIPKAPPTKPEPHPRSGNYTDADVSIEKYFYMGHK